MKYELRINTVHSFEADNEETARRLALEIQARHPLLKDSPVEPEECYVFRQVRHFNLPEQATAEVEVQMGRFDK